MLLSVVGKRLPTTVKSPTDEDVKQKKSEIQLIKKNALHMIRKSKYTQSLRRYAIHNYTIPNLIFLTTFLNENLIIVTFFFVC